MRDEIPALQHRLMVGEETVELHERRDRHDEHRVVRLRRHEAGERSHGGGVGDMDANQTGRGLRRRFHKDDGASRSLFLLLPVGRISA